MVPGVVVLAEQLGQEIAGFDAALYSRGRLRPAG